MSKFRGATFAELLHQVVDNCADHPALIDAEGTWSYRDLETQSATMARSMLSAGVGKGSRISVLAPIGKLWAAAYYAGLRIGAVVTSVSTVATPSELAYIIRQSDTQYVVGTRRFMRHDYAEKLAEGLGIDAGGSPNIRVSTAPLLRRVWFDDASDVSWADSVDDLIAGADETCAPTRGLLAEIESEVSPADDALVIFTSGSTALPKAVVHRQSSVGEKPGLISGFGGYAMSSDDRVLPLMPPFWMGGLMAAFTVLASGATLVCPDSVDPGIVAEAMIEHEVTRVIGAAPRDMRLREALIERGGEQAASVAGLPGTGSALNAMPDRRFEGSTGAGSMGMTESFGYHTVATPAEFTSVEHAGTVGRVLPGMDWRIVDPATGRDVEVGQQGELWLRGGTMMSGYYKVDRSETFTPDGYLATKDRVAADPDGYLYFFGRMTDMLKSKGASVSRIEVENTLLRIPEVDLGFVVGLADDEYGQMVVAAVVPKPGCRPTERELQDAMRKELSGFKVPRRIVFIEHGEVAYTGTGKARLSSIEGLIAAKLASSGPDKREDGRSDAVDMVSGATN